MATKRKRTKDDKPITLTINFTTNFLPNETDLDHAIHMMALAMANTRHMDADKVRHLAHTTQRKLWLALLNEGMIRARDSGRGARGPRLPAGVTFTDLLPHLSEAQRAFNSTDTRFEDWLQGHTWPGGIRPLNTTVRKWLTRYAKWIAAYDEGMSYDQADQ